MGIAKIRHLRSKIRRMGASCTNIIGMRLTKPRTCRPGPIRGNRSDATQEPAFGVVEDAVAQVSVLAQNLSTIPPE